MCGSDQNAAVPCVGDAPLDAADAVARAVFLWARCLGTTEPRSAREQRCLAAGLMSGLCEQLQLEPHVLALVSYAYTLMDGETDQALAVSRSLLIRPDRVREREAFDRGLGDAAVIAEMLACGNHKM